jgi:hypothetical protein
MQPAIRGEKQSNRLLRVALSGVIWFDLIAALVVGFAYARYLVGPHVLNPTNIRWLRGDAVQYYATWALYRHDPRLHWPITFTDWINYPIGESISFLDPNPLLAVLLKPFSAFLPQPFQYLGLEAILVCSLQVFFAARLFQLLLGRRLLSVLLPTLFFLLSPPLALRLGAHFTLTNQWLLIAALYLFCLAHWEPTLPIRRFISEATLLAFISFAINPYLAFPVLLVLSAAVFGLLFQRRLTPTAAVRALAILGTTSLLSAYIFGFIASGTKGYTAVGYRYYSLNLLAPFDPDAYGSLLLSRLPHFTEGQYEGYSYLGVGVIMLLICAPVLLIARRSKLPHFQWQSAIPLIVACVLLTGLALSTQITAGSKLLIDFDPSQKLTPYLSILRSSARLFWFPYYVVVASVIALPYLLLSRRWASTLVAVALIIQIADLMPLRRAVRSAADVAFETPLKSAIWSRLGQTYKNLIVIPPLQCGAESTPGGEAGFRIFGMLGANQNIRTNEAFFSGRPIDQSFCVTAESSVKDRPLSPASVYIASPAVATQIISKGTGRCHNLDGFVLCSAADDFGLGPADRESPINLWIQSNFKSILLRQPTNEELAKWAKPLSNSMARADLIVDLLSSSEFEDKVLPRFQGCLERNERWPTFAEWMQTTQVVAATEGGGRSRHILKNQNLAVVCVLYFALLGRDASLEELSSWAQVWAQGSLRNVVLGFLGSPEYQSKHVF